MNFIFTKHANNEIKRRDIPKQFVLNVLEEPEQIIKGKRGNKIYQSRVQFKDGKKYLLRVIVDEEMIPPRIITVYRTSKIEKYWRE